MKNQRSQGRLRDDRLQGLAHLVTAIALLLGAAILASSQVVPPSWTNTGNLNTARNFGHTETLLPNGKVLVAGGAGNNGSLISAELYDPLTGAWSATGNLNAARDSHTATLLHNGKVLAAGGFSCAPRPQTCSDLNSAELYDPATATWTTTGNLGIARSGHTATLLSNGEVLIVGGTADTAELYDPATGNWSRTAKLNLNYFLIHHTAILLPTGEVLLAGGLLCGGMFSVGGTDMAELYDPATGTWSSTGNLNTARELHTATLLSNGKVLIAGGFIDSDAGLATNSAEVYDPATGTWSISGNLNTARAYHTATLLLGGKVLVAGGRFWRARWSKTQSERIAILSIRIGCRVNSDPTRLAILPPPKI